MKTTILIMCLAFAAHSQTDTTFKKQITNIQLNLEKCHDIYELGIMIHGAGAMTDIISLVGYNQKFMDQQQFYNLLIIGGFIHLSAACVTIYSHRYIGKAGLKVSLTGLKYNF